MPRYVAFLRAVNVGGRIVKMDALRGHFAAAGFANVETFIASGNVIFDTRAKAGPALEAKIEAALEEGARLRGADVRAIAGRGRHRGQSHVCSPRRTSWPPAPCWSAC